MDKIIIDKDDYQQLVNEESIIDTLLQCSTFEKYFPDVASKMLEIKRGVYGAIQDAGIDIP